MTNTLNENLCQAFTWPRCKDPGDNERRLLLRQQLEALVREAWPVISRDFLVRPSLTHPHQFNQFKVSSVRINAGRTPDEQKPLKAFLGREFKDAIASPSRSMHVEARLDEHGLSCGVRIPSEAWWDFQPLLADAETGDASRLEKLKTTWPRATLMVKSWPGEESVRDLDAGQWIRILKSLRPGEYDFSIATSHGFGSDPIDFLRQNEAPLISVFKELAWNPDLTS